MSCNSCDTQCPSYDTRENYFCGLHSGCIQGQVLDARTGYQNATFKRTTGKSYVVVNPKKVEGYAGPAERRSGLAEQYGAFSISAAVRPPYGAYSGEYGCGRCRGACGCNCNSGAPCECPYILGVS